MMIAGVPPPPLTLIGGAGVDRREKTRVISGKPQSKPQKYKKAPSKPHESKPHDLEYLN